MSAKRVLVCGGGGMLGHRLVLTLAAAGHHVRASLRSAPSEKSLLARLVNLDLFITGYDLTDEAAITRAIAAAEPDVIVNCVGIIKQKPGAQDAIASVEVNSLLPHRLARAAEAAGARLIHISTDCVFSGAVGGYREDDLPDPPDIYGRSKLLGEVGAPHVTLRTSLIGWQAHGAESLLNWFWAQKGEIRGFTHAIFSGLSTPALSRVILGVIDQAPDLAGLYHVAAAPISKHELLSRLNDLAGGRVGIRPDADFAIDRSLNGSRFEEATGLAAPSWDDMLSELVDIRKFYDDD